MREIEAIVVGEDKGAGIVSCPRVDNWGSVSYGCQEVENIDGGNHGEDVEGERRQKQFWAGNGLFDSPISRGRD